MTGDLFSWTYTDRMKSYVTSLSWDRSICTSSTKLELLFGPSPDKELVVFCTYKDENEESNHAVLINKALKTACGKTYLYQ